MVTSVTVNHGKIPDGEGYCLSLIASCCEGRQHIQFTYFHFTTITINCSANAR